MAKKKSKLKQALSLIKKVQREQRLLREKMVGKTRSKTWQSRPSIKQDRKKWKNKKTED